MESIFNMVYYIVPFIVLLGILVFVHEFGHFIIARISGVEVSAFSIGFGKVLWSKTDKKGTVWKITAVPLGGYCQFLGDEEASSSTSDTSKLTDEQKKRAFAFQSPYKKLAIVLAGPGFNYLFAILIYTCLFAFLGKITFPPIVGEVMENSAAYEAGLEKGDRILSINGVAIDEFADIAREVAMAADYKTKAEVKRGEDVLNFDIVLTEIEADNANGVKEKRHMLGVKSVSEIEISDEKTPLYKAFAYAVEEVYEVTATTLRGVAQMIKGDRGSDDIGGIIRIAEMTGDISKSHSILNFMVFMALLSVNLGLINLFPIPVLDGGHVVFYTIEIIARRELNAKVKDYLFKAGFALLLALMIFATYNDIVHLFNRWFNS
ncbi:MAG: RIP metalloprotease RseP [Alphaproteobacteria bacterium]|nr:RIP metalloprotease RseP [Alphaproteobacteria bacterium]